MSYFETMVKPCLIDRYKVKDSIFNGGMFNGLEYQVVTNPVTGRQWLDRNLGATRVATAVNDADAYGHLFQWGRLFDGHEIRTSPTRNVQSTGDIPGHGDFIIEFTDWRNPSNNDLWQGVDAINSVAPNGWRLPTEAEWNEEGLTWGQFNLIGAFESPLVLPSPGYRIGSNGNLDRIGTFGYYQTMTTDGAGNRYFRFYSSAFQILSAEIRALGFSVRLIKNI